MANWKKITTDADLTAISASLTTTDQAISASVAALSGSASTARGLLGGGGNAFPYTGSAEITGSLGVTGSVSYSTNIIPIPGAWSSTNALNSEYPNGVAGAGTQTAGLAFNGSIFSAADRQTEEYNGTSWSIGGTPLSNSNYSNFDGSGTQNDAMLLGSVYGTGQSQNYNGSLWIVGGTMSNNLGFSGQAGASVNTSLAFGGYDSNLNDNTTCTEEYNGTSWSSGGALATGRMSLAGTGTQTAALAVGGSISTTATSCTEEYDGTSWSSGGALSTARRELAGAGIQNAALAFGGDVSGNVSCTEEYDGTSWTVGGALSTARNCLAGAGTPTSGLAAGGGFSGRCTEEYTSVIGGFTKTLDYSESTGNITISNDATLTLTGSAKFQSTTSAIGDVWYQSGGLINPRGGLGGAGSANASLAIGGYDSNLGAILSCVEEYNGATWSVGSSLNIGLKNMGSTGALNSALSFGGYDGSYSTTSVAQEYNGSTWSSNTSMSIPRHSLSGAGEDADNVITFGGASTCNNTECWSGGVWSTCAIMSNGRKWMGGTGNRYNAMAFGGSNGSSALSCTEKYNFGSWTTCSPMPIAKYGVGAAGGSTAGLFGSVDSLVFGGRGTSGGGCISTECFVSNVWSATQNMNSENYVGGYSGIENAALSFGGYDGSSQGTTSNTERFNTSTQGGVGIDALSFDTSTGKTMIIPPTTDPRILGALWNSNGTLAISLG